MEALTHPDRDSASWQASWDAQQAVFLPDRETRFAALLDVVEAIAGDAPRVLDLAGGTGSITRRLLDRFPAATSTVLDVDAALLEIARATFAGDDRVAVVRADLGTPAWRREVSGAPYDAVLTATALHWLADARRATLYAEVRDVLRPGGAFVNADHMPDPGLPTLTAALGELEVRRRERAWAAGDVLSWEAWWAAAREDGWLGPFVAERDAFYGADHAADSTPPVDWHLDALRAAGFAPVTKHPAAGGFRTPRQRAILRPPLSWLRGIAYAEWTYVGVKP
jgi:SAM-dependent methyltransferase